MKPITVNYAKTFNLGNYCSEKIGVEIQLDENDLPEDALSEAKNMVEKFHSDNIPVLPIIQQKEQSPPEIILPKPPIQIKKKTQEESIIEQIQQCSSKPILESFKLIVKGKEKLQEAYDQKLKSLTNK